MLKKAAKAHADQTLSSSSSVLPRQSKKLEMEKMFFELPHLLLPVSDREDRSIAVGTLHTFRDALAMLDENATLRQGGAAEQAPLAHATDLPSVATTAELLLGAWHTCAIRALGTADITSTARKQAVSVTTAEWEGEFVNLLARAPAIRKSLVDRTSQIVVRHGLRLSDGFQVMRWLFQFGVPCCVYFRKHEPL